MTLALSGKALHALGVDSLDHLSESYFYESLTLAATAACADHGAPMTIIREFKPGDAWRTRRVDLALLRWGVKPKAIEGLRDRLVSGEAEESKGAMAILWLAASDGARLRELVTHDGDMALAEEWFQVDCYCALELVFWRDTSNSSVARRELFEEFYRIAALEAELGPIKGGGFVVVLTTENAWKTIVEDCKADRAVCNGWQSEGEVTWDLSDRDLASCTCVQTSREKLEGLTLPSMRFRSFLVRGRPIPVSEGGVGIRCMMWKVTYVPETLVDSAGSAIDRLDGARPEDRGAHSQCPAGPR